MHQSLTGKVYPKPNTNSVQEMCSEQPEGFPVSSSTIGGLKAKPQPDPAHFGKNNFFICKGWKGIRNIFSVFCLQKSQKQGQLQLGNLVN